VDGFEWNKEQNYRKRVDFTIITELNVWGVLLKEINCHNTKCTVYSFLKYVTFIRVGHAYLEPNRVLDESNR